jgi:hypothetical protein
MRFKSASVDGIRVFAVSGTNTISFALAATENAKRGLLGFVVERTDPTENQHFVMPGFKVFRSIIPHPDEKTQVSTFDHPIQSFVWDDFTAKPDREYEYAFRPLRGKPQNLDRRAKPIPIKVRTEPSFSKNAHDIFFNRGVASSQAYRRRFGNKKPDALPKAKQAEALEWLSRELDEAILKFIDAAGKADTLLCCFYEFRYRPVADAIKAAIRRGVNVKLIVDAKKNKPKDSKGHLLPPFPRTENLKMIGDARIPRANVIERDANPSVIQHNKFMVRLKGQQARPVEVWTGSTNISLGGITGQTNVGHWVRNESVARQFKAYWDLLATNPGATTKATARAQNAAYRTKVANLAGVPANIVSVAGGVTPVFSPRAGLVPLNLYVDMLDTAETCGAVTLAFGVNKLFKKQLQDNKPESCLVFLLLEKKDKPNKRSKDPFVAINASNNVYKAWGSFIKEPVYQWAKETNARILGLNKHVSYIHSKFLLMDPMGDDPIVVTGSANFSEASTNDNDENMLIIRGDRRVADIYFTEFNRLFNHYYFRAVYEDTAGRNAKDRDASLFLDETGKEWQKKYTRGKLRAKRVGLYTGMKGAITL